jgi:uncharacterized protein
MKTMARRVFVTGGTGFMGRAMIAALRARGHAVVVLTRDAARTRDLAGDGVELIEGDPTFGGDWQAALEGVDAVINLAGQSVGEKRWTAQYKQLIHDSRVETTRFVVEGMAALAPGERPAVLVSASGVDYYPFAVDLGAALDVAEDEEITEATPSGDTFLARVCRNWESEAMRAEPLGVRVVRMRTGVVLGKGGPLDKMAAPFRMFLGGRLGSGRQWVSWVHLADAVSAYLHVMDHDALEGPVNLVAPGSVRAAELARCLGAAMNRPAWLPVPGFAVKLAVGEFAEHILNGRRAVPAALLRHGFEFAYPDLEPALAEIFGR